MNSVITAASHVNGGRPDLFHHSAEFYTLGGLALAGFVLAVLAVIYARWKLGEVHGMYQSVIEHIAGKESARVPQQRAQGSRDDSYKEEAT